MEKIEEILKLETQLSQKIEEAEKKAKDIILQGQHEAEDILAGVRDEISEYQDQIHAEIDEALGLFRSSLLERFEEHKKDLEQRLDGVRQEYADSLRLKILGYDS